jgi:hypothetical protein
MYELRLNGVQVNVKCQTVTLFDTFGGCSFSPLSISNHQVSIGGVNIFQDTMFYSWQEYIEQVSLFDKLPGVKLITVGDVL